MSGTSQTSIRSFEESKPTLADALKKYLMIKSASFRSEATLKQYESINGAFVRALGADQPVEEIDELDAIEYVHSLRTREFRYINTDHKPTQEGGLTYESIRTHINVIKIFTRWIARKYAVGDWLEDVEIPPVRQSEPKAISSNDFKRLVDATEKSLCPQRDMAILFILLDGMVRRKALVNMKIGNLDLVRNRAKVIEKGHKLHTVRWSHLHISGDPCVDACAS